MAAEEVRSLRIPCWGLPLLIALIGCSSLGGVKPLRTGALATNSWEDLTPQERVAELRSAAQQAADATAEQRVAAANRVLHRFEVERDPVVRQEIVRTMGFLETPGIAVGLQKASRDRDAFIRVAACEAWAERGGATAVRALEELLETDTDVDVQLAATRALGHLPGPDSVRALARVLTAKDPALQLRAMESLQSVTGQEIELDVNKWQAYVASHVPREFAGTEGGASARIAVPSRARQMR